MDVIKQFIDSVGISSKAGLRALTALVVLAFSFMFCHLFIVSLDILAGTPEWLLCLISYALFQVIQILLPDKLYYGDPEKDKYVKAFQMYWPSRYLAQKFGLKEKDASYYWFENFFNAWENPDHPRHTQWKRTLRRGYSCRFIYYCTKFFEILIIVSIMLALIQESLAQLFKMEIFTSKVSLFWRIGFILFVVFLYLVIRIFNRVSPSNLGGVWKRFAEINRMHIEWVDENVKSLDDLKKPKS